MVKKKGSLIQQEKAEPKTNKNRLHVNEVLVLVLDNNDRFDK